MASVEGTCDPRFQQVQDVLQALFDEGELGASCAVVHRGELVVDLWGGHRDVARSQPWERDTVVNLWSTTKLLAALAALVLHDRGALSVDDRVATHWPELGEAGKEAVLVRHLLSHTAGLPGFDPPIDEDTTYDWDACCANLAAQRPWWEPGDGSGYHSGTYGHLVGEVVRRVTGQTLGTFLDDEVVGPLGVELHLGVPEAVDGQVAEVASDELVHAPPPTPMAARQRAGEPDHVPMVNTTRWRRAELPSSNAHGNARSVARVLSCLAEGGSVDGVRLLGPATIERALEVQAHGVDRILGKEARFGIGFGMHCAGMPIGVHDRTLFWAGRGGSMAVIDVDHRVTVAFAMNRMLPDDAAGLRAARVVFATHEAAAALRP